MDMKDSNPVYQSRFKISPYIKPSRIIFLFRVLPIQQVINFKMAIFDKAFEIKSIFGKNTMTLIEVNKKVYSSHNYR